MNTQDLLELALLDALGMLDEPDSRAFDEAFDAASPQIQAHVRREQARFALYSGLLPEADPSPELRQRVIEAVRLAAGGASTPEEVRLHLAGHLGARSAPGRIAMIPSRKVSPIWRAVSLGAAAAAVVLGVHALQVRTEYTRLESTLGDMAFNDLLRQQLPVEFGDTVFASSSRLVNFQKRAGVPDGQAVLVLDDESGKAVLLCRDLPPTPQGSYELVIVGEDGGLGDRLAEFTSDGGLLGRSIRVSLSPGQRLAIVPPGATSMDQALLESRAL